LAVTLSTLAVDVGESVHILATHDSARIPMILNRSLSEYRLRLQFYMKHPDKATEDLETYETEMRSVMAARPIAELEQKRDPEMMKNVREFLSGFDVKVTRRQIQQMFQDVYGDKADLLHNLHTVSRARLRTVRFLRRATSCDVPTLQGQRYSPITARATCSG
jgi:hypothetical protein